MYIELRGIFIKIILSRKSFDSKYGGIPNIIFENSCLLSLPIPANKYVFKENFNKDKYEPTEFCHLEISTKIKDFLKANRILNVNNYAELIIKLIKNGKGKKVLNLKEKLEKSLYSDNNREPYYCHLDPDLIKENLERDKEWRGLFGISPDFQKYLRDQIKKNDLFLFFGTFRHVIIENGNIRYAKRSDGKNLIHKGKHIIYGYLQIDQIIENKGDTKLEDIKPWMHKPHHHPHLDKGLWEKPNNALYVAKKFLYLDGKETKLPGWGIFNFSKDLILSEEGRTKRVWKKKLFPKGSIIMYKQNPITQDNWNKDGCFEWKSYGQEFVLEKCVNFENHVKNKIFKQI